LPHLPPPYIRTVANATVIVQKPVSILIVSAIVIAVLVVALHWIDALDSIRQVPLLLHFKQATRAQTVFPQVFLFLHHHAPAFVRRALLAGQNFSAEFFRCRLAGVFIGALTENSFERYVESNEFDQL